MTQHDHTAYVEGCFRCELSREEPLPPPEPFERIYGYDVEEYDPYGDGRDDREL